MNKKIILLGAGGHAHVLIEAIESMKNSKILGLVDSKMQKNFSGYPILGNDDIINDYSIEDIALVNGLGFVPGNDNHQVIYKKYRDRGFDFYTVIHSYSGLSDSLKLGHGAQIMLGVVVQPGVSIGDNSVINTRASIDHDCHIGNHCHIAPGAVLCGDVNVGNKVFIGAGAIVKHGIMIADNAVIAAGAVVVKDVEPGATMVGVPARMEKNGCMADSIS